MSTTPDQSSTSTLDQALNAFMQNIRDIPHYSNRNDEWGDQKLGHGFDEACGQLARNVRSLLTHPDLQKYDATTLEHALSPLYESFRAEVESMRHHMAATNEDIRCNRAPFLSHDAVENIIKSIDHHFTAPDCFYAKAGIVLQADFHQHMRALKHSPLDNLRAALNNMMTDVANSHRHTLFTTPEGTPQPQAGHKLTLLGKLAEKLCDRAAGRSISGYSAEARARMLETAIGLASSPEIRQDWETILSPSNSVLQATARRCEQFGIQHFTSTDLDASGWDAMLDPKPAPAGEGQVVDFRHRTAAHKRDATQRLASQPAATTSTEPPTGVISFAERAKARDQAAHKDTQR